MKSERQIITVSELNPGQTTANDSIQASLNNGKKYCIQWLYTSLTSIHYSDTLFYKF